MSDDTYSAPAMIHIMYIGQPLFPHEACHYSRCQRLLFFFGGPVAMWAKLSSCRVEWSSPCAAEDLSMCSGPSAAWPPASMQQQLSSQSARRAGQVRLSLTGN